MEAITLAVEAEDIRTLVIDENRNGENIKAELEKTFGEGKVIVTDAGTNSFYITINDDLNRGYKITEDGTVTKREVIRFAIGKDCDSCDGFSADIWCEAYPEMTWEEWNNSAFPGAGAFYYFDNDGDIWDVQAYYDEYHTIGCPRDDWGLGVVTVDIGMTAEAYFNNPVGTSDDIKEIGRE